MGNDDAVSSLSLIEETIHTKTRKQLTKTLTSSQSLHALPLPTLPFDLIPEILCRLPVRFLNKFRCVCKSWNSLITDSKFAKKHLSLSTTSLVHSLHCTSGKYVLKSYPLDSIFSDVATEVVPLEFPSYHYVYFVGSCNGILCLFDYYKDFVKFRLWNWNPSIRKYKELPQLCNHVMLMFGLGHDPITDNYKVVVVSHARDSSGNLVDKTDAKAHTLGTNLWKNIEEFPFVCTAVEKSGNFLSGKSKINWLAFKQGPMKNQCIILSIDLGNESYQEVLLPNYGEVDAYKLHLSVLKDCMCMFSGNDVWVMKEYGNKDSWTKLFTISYMIDPHPSCVFIKAMHIFEDGQVLLKLIGDVTMKMIVYNSRNCTIKYPKSPLEYTEEVCVESLISPCF